MKPKILYIMSSYNLYGGTPKKTLDLMKHFGKQSSIYVYHDLFPELKCEFEKTGGNVHEGFYGRNIVKHVRKLISLIDKEKIDIVQTQFSMGETLGYFIKLFRPKVKLIIAFVGAYKPLTIKSVILNKIYSKTDSFIYISKYVKTEKIKQFSILKEKNGTIIYNGTSKREDNGAAITEMKTYSLFDIAGLIKLKNIQILIEALNIYINIRGRKDVFLYIAGDGPKKEELKLLIEKYHLQKHVYLLGYQSNVGSLLNNCDIFVHPSYAEGFGIVVPEAMLAEKPIIVSNAGALPELIEDGVNGLIVEPHNAEAWADAISKIIDDPDFSKTLAANAKIRAEKEFSIDKYTSKYENLYTSLLSI